MLITAEGGEGSGKGTLVNNLAAYLRHQGKTVATAREPGTSGVAEDIREVIQRPREENITDVTELFLFQAARAQFVRESLQPALEQHDIVILDRFYDSTTAYQGYGRELDKELIRTVNDYAAHGIEPDITFYLDVSPEIGLRRCERDEFDSDGDRIEQETIAFHKQVREGYHELATNNERIHVIDAESNDAEQVFERAKALLDS